MCVGLCGLLDSVCRSVWAVRQCVLCMSVSQGVRIHVSVSNVSDVCTYVRTCVCCVSVCVSGCVPVCLYMLW